MKNIRITPRKLRSLKALSNFWPYQRLIQSTTKKARSSAALGGRRKRLLESCSGWSGTLEQFLDLESVCDDDKIWVFAHLPDIPDKIKRKFAVYCMDRCHSGVEEVDTLQIYTILRYEESNYGPIDWGAECFELCSAQSIRGYLLPPTPSRYTECSTAKFAANDSPQDAAYYAAYYAAYSASHNAKYDAMEAAEAIEDEIKTQVDIIRHLIGENE